MARAASFSLLLVLGVAVGLAIGGPYTPDLYWPNAIPEGAGAFTAVAVDDIRSEVYVAQKSANYSQPILVFDKEGNLLRSWGRDTISFDNGFGVHGLKVIPSNSTPYIYVTDTGDHTVKKYDFNGTLLKTLGTRGTAGSSLRPLQFGNVADIDGDADSSLFIGDGDGGVNNRVVAVDNYGILQFVDGGVAASKAPGQFNSPHSVAYFNVGLIFVADRGNNRTEIFSSTTGKYISEWTCTQPGTPWGVRVWNDELLLFVADGNSHIISILDLGQTDPSNPGECSVLTTVPVDPTVCNQPHLLDIDVRNGELYLACVGTPSKVMRFHQECAGRRDAPGSKSCIRAQ